MDIRMDIRMVVATAECRVVGTGAGVGEAAVVAAWFEVQSRPLF